MADKRSSPANQRVISAFMLAMINVAFMITLRDIPPIAEYGYASVTLFLLAAVMQLIPGSLVSAELATGWPDETGGVYVWLREAFGPRVGLLGIWLEWIENIPWFAAVLSFTAGALASHRPSHPRENLSRRRDAVQTCIGSFALFLKSARCLEGRPHLSPEFGVLGQSDRAGCPKWVTGWLVPKRSEAWKAVGYSRRQGRGERRRLSPWNESVTRGRTGS